MWLRCSLGSHIATHAATQKYLGLVNYMYEKKKYRLKTGIEYVDN